MLIKKRLNTFSRKHLKSYDNNNFGLRTKMRALCSQIEK